MSRLRGRMMFWPPMTTVPPDHTSAGLLSVMRSISPTTSARVGAVGIAAPAVWARAGNTSRAQSPATMNRRTVKSDNGPGASFDLIFMTTTPLLDACRQALSRSTSPPAAALVGVAFRAAEDGLAVRCCRNLHGRPSEKPSELLNFPEGLKLARRAPRCRVPGRAQAERLRRGQLNSDA